MLEDAVSAEDAHESKKSVALKKKFLVHLKLIGEPPGKTSKKDQEKEKEKKKKNKVRCHCLSMPQLIPGLFDSANGLPIHLLMRMWMIPRLNPSPRNAIRHNGLQR